MADQHDTDRWREIRTIHKEYGNFYWGMALAALFVLGVWVGRNLFPNKGLDFDLNIVTELLGGLVVGSAFAFLENRRSEQRHKLQLVEDVASSSNEIAKHALHQIRRRGWLHGLNGILIGQDLTSANLQNTNLQGANLSNARLSRANLEKATLNKANLQNASLFGTELDNAEMHSSILIDADLQGARMFRAKLSSANLRDANLINAKLQKADLLHATFYGAILWNADFEDAVLVGCDLRNADLTDADLLGANLRLAKLDATTRLPDGTIFTDTEEKVEIALKRFTDHKNDAFWRSDNPVSPAWRGRPVNR